MHTPILVIVVLAAGVALSLAVFTIAGNQLMLWGSGSRVYISDVDISVDPSTMLSYITVNVVNAGGRTLTACSARLLNPPVDIDDITPSNIRAGQAGSFYESRVSGLTPPNIYQVEVVCTADDGSTVVDKRSAQAHT